MKTDIGGIVFVHLLYFIQRNNMAFKKVKKFKIDKENETGDYKIIKLT